MVFMPKQHNPIQSQGNISQTDTEGPSTKSLASTRCGGEGRGEAGVPESLGENTAWQLEGGVT